MPRLSFQRLLERGSIICASIFCPFWLSSVAKQVIPACLILGFSVLVHAQAPTTTTLAITSSGGAVTTVAAGTVVTLTATVQSGATPVTPGLVKFCDATAQYCEDFHIAGSAQLTSAGTAVFRFRPAIGNHSYSAVFVGTRTYASSTSDALSLSVTGGVQPTTTAVTFSGTDGHYSLNGTVTGTGVLTPPMTGTVSFLNTTNGNALGTATITSSEVTSGVIIPASVNNATGYPDSIVSADLNGDGIPDIAVVSPSAINVALGNGDGSFRKLTESVPGLSSAASAQVADFNSDGIPDLVVADMTAQTITVLLGNGDGTFTATSPIASGPFDGITVADFNNDGIPDIAAVNGTILLGKGDGTFTAASSSLGITTTAAQIVSADFNGDGNQDIAVVSSTGTVNTFLGHGDGTFAAGSTFSAAATAATGMVVADFNGDGIPDLAIDLLISNRYSVLVFLGAGNGNFTPAPASTGQPGFETIALGDFNGDGIPDIGGGFDNSGRPQVALALGKGDGTFDPYIGYKFATTSIFANAVVGDFNGDGFSDLALSLTYLAGSTTSAFAVQLTQPEETAVVSVPLAPGQYSAQASYSGDSNFAPSTSSAVAVSNQLATQLSVTLTPSLNLVAGESVVFTAQLSPYSYMNDSTNGETVSFYEGSVLLGTGVLSNGVATLTANIQGPTTAPDFTSTYAGDDNFASTFIGLSSNAIAKDQPSLVLSVSLSGSTQGQPVTLSAAISGYYGSIDGEAITFLSNGKAIGKGTIISAATSLTLSTLPAGINGLTAVYSGDVNNLNATSNAIEYSVAQSGLTGTAVSLAVTSAGAAVTSVAPGTPVTLTATVTAAAAPVTPGTVIFCDTSISSACKGTAMLGTAQLTAQGTASQVVRLGIGTHTLVALFAGTTSLGPSPSSQSTLTVTGQFATTVQPFFTPDPDGDYLEVTFRIAAVAPSFAGPLTGTAELGAERSGSTVTLLTFPFPESDSVYQAGVFDWASTTFPATGNTPFSIVAADVNHDGIPDLIVANSADNTVGVLLGSGGGAFKSQVTYAVGVGAFAVAVGDFNNDGNPDLAVTNFSDGTVSVLLGNGDGTFKAQKTYTVGTGPASVVIADLNGDGNLDLAVANEKDNTVSILLGNGDGTFQAQQTFATGNSPAAIAGADFNGDGVMDLAVANNVDGTVGILLGNGNGTFQSMVPYAVGANPTSIAAADFNGDGNIDLAVTNISSNTVSVLFGNGDGTLQTQTAYSTGASSGPEAVIAGDLAGQGNADLAVANSALDAVEVFVNNGSGQFTASTTQSNKTGSGPLSLAAGDWNGDGLLDLAALNNTGNTATIFLNISGPKALLTGPYVNVDLPGTNTVVAQYSGDATYAGSEGTSQESLLPRDATTLTLSTSGSVNPSDYGQSVTLVAKLAPYSWGPAPLTSDGDSVTFTEGSTVLGTGTLASGVASLTVSTLPVGANSLKASFAGDDGLAASTSAAFTQTVRPAILTVTASNATRAYGVPNPALTGTVSGAVNGDTFTVTGTTTAAPASPPGAYPITPSVSGADLGNYTVTKVNGSLTVTQAVPSVALSTSAAEVFASTPVTFTANVTASGSGSAPTGTVSFYDGATLLGTGTLTSGAATYTTSSLSTATHSITAVYSGDTNFTTATSTALSEVIVSSFTFATASGGSSSATASPGGKATYTLSVAPPGNATFPNAITFAVTGLPAGATATFSPATISAGAGATNVTLTITLAASAAAIPMKKPFSGLPYSIALGMILLPFAGLRRAWQRQSVTRVALFLVLGAALAVALTGCGGGSSSSGTGSQQPQNYTLTVTATSGTLSQNATLQLTVE